MKRLFAFIADRMRQDRPAMPTPETERLWRQWSAEADAAEWWQAIERNLAARKAMRAARSDAAIKGHQTRRAKA